MKQFVLINNNYPECEFEVGDIISENDINHPKLIKELIEGKHEKFWEEYDPSKSYIYDFQNGWKPLKNLIFRQVENRTLWVWCEFPGGGAARELHVDHIKGTYIKCDVEFVNSKDPHKRVPQGAVCYSFKKIEEDPYTNENHRNIWRQIIELTNVRTIRYGY